MKSISTLEKVSEKVDQFSRYCTDTMIPVQDISFDHLETVRIAGEEHSLRPIAQQSIAWRLGIPIQYLRKCPPEVQAYNMNHWIEHEKNPELFFRFDSRDVRAIFTPKYTPVDNFEIMERLDSLGYGPDTQVQCHLDQDFMSLSILEGRQSFEIDGDRMTPGISIGNSEVGLSSLSIAAFVLRLVCTNGMISTSAVSASFRHVSRKILEEFPQVMTRVGNELGRQKNQFRISMKSPVDNPLMTIEAFNRKFGLSTQEKEAVEWGHRNEPGKTMFFIVQAYTRGAQFQGLNAESVHKLQKTGGMILSMVN
jgi:hypothetical protein